MLKINLCSLNEVNNSLEKFQKILTETQITRPTGNWSPKVQIATDIYLTNINSQLNNDFSATAIKYHREISNFIDKIQLQDAF